MTFSLHFGIVSTPIVSTSPELEPILFLPVCRTLLLAQAGHSQRLAPEGASEVTINVTTTIGYGWKGIWKRGGRWDGMGPRARVEGR